MTVRACTQANLLDVLRISRPGDVVRITGAIYPKLTNLVYAGPGITLVAAPGASLSGWGPIENCEGITFRGFFAKAKYGGGMIGVVGRSRRIVFEDMQLTGLGPLPKEAGGVGIVIGGGVTVRRCTFSQMSCGISMQGARDIVIEDCAFRDLYSDAITGNPRANVILRRNRFRDFRGPPLHLDAMQFHTSGLNTTVENILIEDNIYERGTGSPAQFIFMGDDTGVGYKGVIVRRNAALGPSWHGVMISHPRDTQVIDNFIQGIDAPYDGKVIKSWIDMQDAGPNVTLQDNFSTAYVNRGSPNLIMKDNEPLGVARGAARSDLDDWLKRHAVKPRADSSPAGPALSAAALLAAGGLEAVGSRRAALALALTSLGGAWRSGG